MFNVCIYISSVEAPPGPRRLSISIAIGFLQMSLENDQHPLSKEFSSEPLQAAERLARKTGTPVGEFLDSVRERALDPNFPSPDCLTPYEVSEFCEAGTLPAERLSHRQTCVYCSSMLSALEPNEISLALFRDRLSAYQTNELPFEPQPERKKISLKLLAPVGVLAFASVVVLAFLPGINQKAGDTTTPNSVQTSNSARPSATAPTLDANPPEAVRGEVLFKNQNRQANELQLSLPLENAKLQAVSYPAAAAATATASLAKTEGNHPSLLRTQLQEQYASALAGWYSANVGENKDLSASQSDSKGTSTISCKELEQTVSVPGLIITDAGNGKTKSRTCLVSYGNAKMSINPKESLEKNHQYVGALESADGDVAALDKAASDVAVRVVPSRSSPAVATLPPK
jgi:hypothetical protein